MTELKYKTFDDWFWETEGFASRGERFLSEYKNMDERQIIIWLKTAWEIGDTHGDSEHTV